MTVAAIGAGVLAASALVQVVDPLAPTLASPLIRSDAPFSARADVNQATSVVLSHEAVWAAMSKHEMVIIAGLPLGPSIDATAALRRIEALAPEGRVVAMVPGARGEAVAMPLERIPAQFWSGSIPGRDGSRIFLAHAPWFTHGYAIVDGRTFIISSGPPGGDQPTVSYELPALPEDAILWNEFLCQTQVAEAVPQPQPGEGGLAGEPLPCRHVKLAIDSDNELAAVFGGNVTATAAYLLLQAAAMNEIYAANVNVRIQASYVRVWTSTDPWTQPGSVSQLFEFRDWWEANMGGVTRDAAMLLSARGLGGGVAWLSAMCGPWAYSVSGNLAGWFPYPLANNSGQNWDIMVTAHELGHNMGSPHTHDFCPPVDQCAPSGYFGQCQSQQVCTNQGTIMSYCHLCSGGLANVLLTFAEATNLAIRQHIESLGCPLLGEPQPPWAVPDFVALLDATIDIDVLANDVPVNCEDIEIDSFTQPDAGTGSVARLVGAGPGGRDLLRYSAPPGYQGVTSFTYTLRDASSQIGLPGEVRVEKLGFWPPTSVAGAAPSLQVKYYDLVSPQWLPDFDLLTPYLVTTTPNINYPSTNGFFANSQRQDNFGAVWTGWINLPVTAPYTLYLNSDDGSKLWIDDVLIVDNDGLHPMVEKSGSAPLAAGRHKLRVEFFEAGGGAGCILSIAGGPYSKQPVPASILSHGGTILTADFNLDGKVDGNDLGFLLGQWGSPGPDADLNGSGWVDGEDLGILLGQWTN